MASVCQLATRSGHFTMLTRTLWRVVGGSHSLQVVCRLPTTHAQMMSHDSTETRQSNTFDEKMLEHLVCPLTKKDLRYDKETNELVSDEIGVAYPIVNGIPNLVPQDARVLKTTDSTSS